jgi:hypothetical protein
MLSNPVSVWHFWFISMVWFVNFARFSSSAVALEEIFQVKQKCHKIQSTFGMPGITRIQFVILNIFQFQRILNVRMCALFVHPCPVHPLEPWHSPSRAGHAMSRYVKMCPICRICMDMLGCCWLMWVLNWLTGDTSFEFTEFFPCRTHLWSCWAEPILMFGLLGHELPVRVASADQCPDGLENVPFLHFAQTCPRGSQSWGLVKNEFCLGKHRLCGL